MHYLNEKGVKLEWIGEVPRSGRKVALLIPQYNECSNLNFTGRLEYFKGIAEAYGDLLDVILIDDGSTDDSLAQMRKFIWDNDFPFYVASVLPNANKVGALYLAVLAISHEFIILSDFDTDIIRLDNMMKEINTMQKDKSMMGCYFRMLPFEGKGIAFTFQQLEYAFARSLYKFHRKEKSIRVMPGAGSCYKRDLLVAIYNEHSGLRSGEDREATMIGLRLGYSTMYMDSVLALTRPPLTIRALVRQRVRWNLGYFETIYKERKYYAQQIGRMTRIGVMTLADVAATCTILLIPLIFLAFILVNPLNILRVVPLLYALHVGWCLLQVARAPEEFAEFSKGKLAFILVYPLIKLYIGYLAWNRAFILFLKKLAVARKKTRQVASTVTTPFLNIIEVEETSVNEQ